MHTVEKHKVKSFRRILNPNQNGINCAFNQEHFIDYREECYQGPYRIIICKQCKGEGTRSKELKYNNIPNEYNGTIYDSMFEAQYAKSLDLLLKVNEIKSWKDHVKIPINILFEEGKAVLTIESQTELQAKGKSYYHICNYKIDFIVTHNDGTTEYVETKGPETRDWQLKWKLMEAALRGKEGVKLTVKKQGRMKMKKKTAAVL